MPSPSVLARSPAATRITPSTAFAGCGAPAGGCAAGVGSVATVAPFAPGSASDSSGRNDRDRSPTDAGESRIIFWARARSAAPFSLPAGVVAAADPSQRACSTIEKNVTLDRAVTPSTNSGPVMPSSRDAPQPLP